MTKSVSLAAYGVLSVAHVAGMIDMVALPLWVGVLIKHFGFAPPQAGGVVTVFLFSVVVASSVMAPGLRFCRSGAAWLSATSRRPRVSSPSAGCRSTMPAFS